MFQMPQYKNSFGDDWGRLSQFGNTPGYLGGSSDMLGADGVTSSGGPSNMLYGGMDTSNAITGNKEGLFASPLQQRNADGSTYGGYLGAGVGLVQGLGSAYMGLKQYGLAKEQLAFQKSAYNKNYAAQRQSTNTGLQDRQAARVASNSGAYESVGSYMDKNRIA